MWCKYPVWFGSVRFWPEQISSVTDSVLEQLRLDHTITSYMECIVRSRKHMYLLGSMYTWFLSDFKNLFCKALLSFGWAATYCFRKVKQRAFYGKWTESLYSFDASLYDDYTTKSSSSHVDQSAIPDLPQDLQQEPSVSYVVFLVHYLAACICQEA